MSPEIIYCPLFNLVNIANLFFIQVTLYFIDYINKGSRDSQRITIEILKVCEVSTGVEVIQNTDCSVL